MDAEAKTSILEPFVSFNYPIDWEKLAQANTYYSQHFTYQEVPFLIPESVSNYTKPHRDQSFILNDGIFAQQSHELIGSAEQGFVYLLLNGNLLADRLYSISPCFRADNYDKTHQPWFMKLELFHLSDKKEDLMNMLEGAEHFFSQFAQTEIVLTGENMYDINIHGLEVGSYGFRHIDDKTFIYGTGIALPRLNIALHA